MKTDIKSKSLSKNAKYTARSAHDARSFSEKKVQGRFSSGKNKTGFGKAVQPHSIPSGSSRSISERNERNNPQTGFRSGQSKGSSHSETFRQFEYSGTPIREQSDLSENAQSNDSFILTGRNPIREALKNHRDLEKLLVQKGDLSGSALEIVKTAKERKILVQVVDKSRLDEIAPQHQGLIAFASAFRYSTIDEMLQNAADRNEDPFLILLDGITDPHNLGAIIRSAECTGAHGIIVPQHRSAGLTPSAVKASVGAIEYMPVARVTNLNRTIEDLQKRNIWVYALTMNGKDYEDVSFSGGIAIVIGAEGDGISKITEEKCDMSVSLPMRGHLDSLNASVAAGVIMYRILSFRRKGE